MDAIRRTALGLAAIALLAGCSPSATASPAAPATAATGSGAPGSTGGACAWPEEVDANSANVLIVDSAAMYWLQPFAVAPGLRITLSGTFPDARYASLQVYTQPAGSSFTRNGVGSTLTDYQIAPDQGSVNPWQHQAAPGGHYTVTLREDVAPGQVNTLPIAPDGVTSGQGLLLYRVYLPASADPAKVPLPTVTLDQGVGSTALAPCTTFSSPLNAPRPSTGAAPTESPTPTPAPSASTRPVGQLQFFKAAITTLGPNADTPYLLAYLTPPGAGDVAVIRGRAPTHATGNHPAPWPAAGLDVRYWSLCAALATGSLPTVMNLAPSGGTDAGCRADDQIRVDAAGDYAIVLGTEAQRAAIEGVAGATFLPLSAAQPATTHLLLLRDMLVSPGFAASPALVAQANDPAAAQAVMGPYYPRAAVCPLSTLVAAGASGCVP